MIFPQPPSTTNKKISKHCTKEQLAAQLTTVMNGLELPLGMPRGPYQTFDQLHEAINEWAKKPSTGGGSFLVKRFSSNPSTKFCGPQKLIMCSQGGINHANKEQVNTYGDSETDDNNKQKKRHETKQQSTTLGCP